MAWRGVPMHGHRNSRQTALTLSCPGGIASPESRPKSLVIVAFGLRDSGQRLCSGGGKGLWLRESQELAHNALWRRQPIPRRMNRNRLRLAGFVTAIIGWAD